MKKFVTIEQVDKEGLEVLGGQVVTLYCLNYIYTGKLVGVNETFVKLEDASIVYETGKYSDKDWKNAEKLPHEWYVQRCCIESFGILK